jgi:hypothetical protein
MRGNCLFASSFGVLKVCYAPRAHVGGGRTRSGYRKVFPAELLIFCSVITFVSRAQPTKTFPHPARIHPLPCGLVGVLGLNVRFKLPSVSVLAG